MEKQSGISSLCDICCLSESRAASLRTAVFGCLVVADTTTDKWSKIGSVSQPHALMFHGHMVSKPL